MSTVVEKVTDEINVRQIDEQEMKKRRPSGKHPYKPQLATKIKWALEDCMLETQDAQRYMLEILDLMSQAWEMKGDDTTWLVHLGKIDHQMAYLALVVSQLERTVTRTLAESKPQQKCK